MTAASLCSGLIIIFILLGNIWHRSVCVSESKFCWECLSSSGRYQYRGKFRLVLPHCPYHGELSFQQLLTKSIWCEVVTCDIMPLETGCHVQRNMHALIFFRPFQYWFSPCIPAYSRHSCSWRHMLPRSLFYTSLVCLEYTPWRDSGLWNEPGAHQLSPQDLDCGRYSTHLSQTFLMAASLSFRPRMGCVSLLSNRIILERTWNCFKDIVAWNVGLPDSAVHRLFVASLFERYTQQTHFSPGVPKHTPPLQVCHLQYNSLNGLW